MQLKKREKHTSNSKRVEEIFWRRQGNRVKSFNVTAQTSWVQVYEGRTSR